eukprot:scaffold9691_cov113-Isochrysis_galbana.AAC.3
MLIFVSAPRVSKCIRIGPTNDCAALARRGTRRRPLSQTVISGSVVWAPDMAVVHRSLNIAALETCPLAAESTTARDMSVASWRAERARPSRPESAGREAAPALEAVAPVVEGSLDSGQQAGARRVAQDCGGPHHAIGRSGDRRTRCAIHVLEPESGAGPIAAQQEEGREHILAFPVPDIPAREIHAALTLLGRLRHCLERARLKAIEFCHRRRRGSTREGDAHLPTVPRLDHRRHPALSPDKGRLRHRERQPSIDLRRRDQQARKLQRAVEVSRVHSRAVHRRAAAHPGEGTARFPRGPGGGERAEGGAVLKSRRE